MFIILFSITLSRVASIINGASDSDMRRLHEQLFSKYNKNVLPVKDPRIPIELLLGLKLDQIVDIDERNQVMTTNVWLIHEWTDAKMTWDPSEFGGLTQIEVPSSLLWIPDVVLYNNADGTFVVDTVNWAHVFYNGTVKWTTPVTYKSQCDINIQYYPFDIQNCTLKFGVWSHGKKQIILRHLSYQVVANPGVELSAYEESIEWDLLSVPAIRHEIEYECCPGDAFMDVTFCIEIRRKTIMVFHLPSASGEKMTLAISIMVALQVFYLLMIEILPSTSVHVPLLGKYLLFTFVFVNISILLALIISNIHFRDPKMHPLPPWARRMFFQTLPPWLLMDKPALPRTSFVNTDQNAKDFELTESIKDSYHSYANELDVIKRNFRLIQEEKMSELNDKIVAEGWAYVALVLDRIFLIIYTFTFLVGTTICLLSAPALYDSRNPLSSASVIGNQ
ncbi:hypothetical protein ACOME3_006635 [Neoechinorhynchus agilis]